jgi:sugar phosphate permease
LTTISVSPTTQARASVGAARSRIRWFVLFLISLMYLITYMDRANISVTASAMAGEFGLSKVEMGLALLWQIWLKAACEQHLTVRAS